MGNRRIHTFSSTLYSHRKHQGLSSVCVWQSPSGHEHCVQDHTGKDGMLLNLKKITVHGDTVLLGASLVLSVQTWFLVPLPHSSCLQHLLLLLVSWHAVVLQLQWRSLLCFPVWISDFSPAAKAIPGVFWKLHKLRD